MALYSLVNKNGENRLGLIAMTYLSGEQIDHYEIIRLLGHGGMGRVYLASDLITREEVVLKFPTDGVLGDIVAFERYKREAEIGVRIHHPNIQQLLNTGEKRSDDYLVIEYIKGQTLRFVLDNHAPDLMPITEALNLIRQICDALAYCHEMGVFHRDIKPENIMVQDDGTIKIIDFGIAYLQGARRVTWRGLSGTVGTPDYMSPEQLKGERGKASSDIYAVGVILYEMLCGHTPFGEENVFLLMNQRVSQDPPSILSKNPALSPELATVVMRAVRRDQDKRYTTMKELLHDLCNLEEVNAVPYEPDVPKSNYAVKTIFMCILIIITICMIIIVLGVLVQSFHNAVR